MVIPALPVETNDLADIAVAWKTSDGDAMAKIAPRLFSIWEITRYLIPIAPAHLRRVLRNKPDLPQGRTGDGDRDARWFSLDDVHRLRKHFSDEGARHKNYLPYRPDRLPAQVVCCAHTAQGTGQTTLAVHLAVAAALDGYRVLAIDLDPQGDLTTILGGVPKPVTAATLMARHHCEYLQDENRLRVSRGDLPVPLEPILSEALSINKEELIDRSRWSGVDLLPSGPDLAAADVRTARWQQSGRAWRPWDWLGAENRKAGLFESYDLIVIDTPPGLGILSISGITASDLLLTPTGAAADCFAATAAFFKLLHQSLSEIEAQENLMAKALGSASTRFNWDAVRTILTQYDPTGPGDMTALMENGPARMLLPARQDMTPLIGVGQGRARCIYDVDYRDFTRETYVTARRSFDETYTEIKEIFTRNWRHTE